MRQSARGLSVIRAQPRCPMPASEDTDDQEPLNRRPLRTEAMRQEAREGPPRKVGIELDVRDGPGAGTISRETRMLKAAMGIAVLGLHTVLLSREAVDGQADHHRAQVRSDELAEEILRDVPCPWSAATLLKEGEKSIDKLRPYRSGSEFRYAQADDASGSTFDAAWIADRQRILRLLGKAAFQARQLSSGVRYIVTNRGKVGEPRSPERQSVMERNLLGRPEHQKLWMLTLPEMIEVAIHGHVNPGHIWLAYANLAPIFEAAICAGFCSIGMMGVLTRDGAEWLKHDLSDRPRLNRENENEIPDFQRCRDLIMNAFNATAQARREDLEATLKLQVMEGLASSSEIRISPMRPPPGYPSGPNFSHKTANS